MAYTAPFIDEAGLHIPAYNDIRDDLVETFKTIYGQDIYLENDSQDYQMISAFALKTYDTMQLLQIVYNNRSPKTAVGTALDGLVKLNGIRRKEASHSTCILTISGDAGTVIPAGIAEDESGNLWHLPKNIRLTEEPKKVTATCDEAGAIEAPPNTITKIHNPQKGWTAVTNAVQAVKGKPIETDEELRIRQQLSTTIASRNLLDGTIAGIASVEGVRNYKVYDNDTHVTDEHGIPSHSIAAVVEGGLDRDIAEQIYLRKGPGGGTYGTTTYTFINLDGGKTPIRFFRPTYEAIDVTIQIGKGYQYTDLIKDEIKEATEKYLESLGIGNAVTVTGVIATISYIVSDMKQPAYFLKSLKIGKAGQAMGTSDIEMEFNAMAKVGTVNVEVV